MSSSSVTGLSVLGHQTRHGAFGEIDSQLELSMQARGAPIRIRGRHLLDQRSGLRAYLRSTRIFPLRNPGPIDSEAFSLPTDNGVRFNQMQDLSPLGPDSRKHDPKHSVFPSKSRDPLPPFEHSQLLSQSQVLQSQVTSLSEGCHNQNS
jgi:hypothetical protein